MFVIGRAAVIQVSAMARREPEILAPYNLHLQTVPGLNCKLLVESRKLARDRLETYNVQMQTIAWFLIVSLET